MIRVSIGLSSLVVLLAVTSRAEAQQFYAKPKVVYAQPLPSQTPNTNISAYRVNNHVYAVPFRYPAPGHHTAQERRAQGVQDHCRDEQDGI